MSTLITTCAGSRKFGRSNLEALDTKRIIRKTYGAVIPWLFFTVIWTYLDRSNLSFSALSFKRDLHLNNAQYGLGAGIFFLGYCVSMIPSNLIIVRLGGPTWLGIIVCAWGVVGAATAAIKTPLQFYMLRLLLGICEGGTFPGTWWHATLFFSSSELSVGFAAVSSATALSQVIGSLLAAALLQMDTIRGLHGWQWLFILEGAATVVYGAALWICLAETPARAWFLRPAERQWLQARQDRATELAVANARTGTSTNPWAGLINWRLWVLSLCWFLVEASIYGILFWAPLLLDAIFTGNFTGHATANTTAHQTSKQVAWHTTKLALISCVLYVPIAVGMIAIAYSSMRRKERNLHGGIPVLVSGVAFMVLPTAIARSGPAAGVIVLIVAATGAWSLFGPIWSWPTTFLVKSARATGIAAFNTCGALGGFVGPYLIGALSQRGSYSSPMLVFGVFNLVAGVILLVFRPEDLLNERSMDDTALVPDQAPAPAKAAPDGKAAAAPARSQAANGAKRATAAPLEYELQR